ncbi:MAG: PBP1A family penicillin-binding protein [Myxococcota bacterium]
MARDRDDERRDDDEDDAPEPSKPKRSRRTRDPGLEALDQVKKSVSRSAKAADKAPASGSRSRSSRSADGASRSTKPKAAKVPAKRASKPRSRGSRGGSHGGGGGSWFSRPAGGWKRWLLLELATVALGLVVGLGIASAMIWGRARHDVESYLANPPRPIPSIVWSAPIEVHPGMRASLAALTGDLLAAGFDRVEQVDQVAAPEDPGADPASAGVFAVGDDRITVWSAPYATPTGDGPGGAAWIEVRDGKVSATSDRKGLRLHPTVLGTLGDPETERIPVRLAELSPFVEPALLAMEDSRFRSHHGVDPIGIGRALVANLFGQDVQGGSTLTQQLAKNLFLTRDRTLKRKVREVFFAAALEHELDKDELLELYLSEIYLGQMGGLPLYGVEAAARGWFGVSAARLELHQAAMIVGAIPAPNLWSPVRNPEAALERRNLVLDKMLRDGAIDQAQRDAAVGRALELKGLEPSRIRKAPYAVDAAVDKAEEALGEGSLAARGYMVYTGIQPLLQRAAEDAIAQGMTELDAEYPKAAGAQVALVAVRIDDGTVVAMVGGRSYAQSAFNRARDADRQAGSTVKPLTMLAAFDAGDVNPATRLEDQPISRSVDGVTWTPKNYDNKFLGEVSVREAIEGSRNIPAIHLAETVGMGPLQRFYRQAGMSQATHLPSAALGSFAVTPIEMAGAYSAFGHGIAYRPRVLIAITDATGHPVLELPPEGYPIASEQAAALAVHVLQGVIESGTASRASRYGVGAPAAGKTGTTDDYRDAWFVGLTPELAVAVWVGQDEGILGLSGSRAALPTWARFVEASGTNRGTMPRPGGIVELAVCSESGMIARDACPSTFDEWFVDGHVPEDKCDVHGGPVIRPGRLFGRLFGRHRGEDEDAGAPATIPDERPDGKRKRPRN